MHTKSRGFNILVAASALILLFLGGSGTTGALGLLPPTFATTGASTLCFLDASGTGIVPEWEPWWF